MRGLPFFKPKKGAQFAGLGFSDGSGGGSYVLPTASASTLGGVKVGSNLSIDANGVLSTPDGVDPSMIAGAESTTTSTHAYAIGDYFISSTGLLCKATSAIAIDDTISIGTSAGDNAISVTVGGELSDLNSKIGTFNLLSLDYHVDNIDNITSVSGWSWINGVPGTYPGDESYIAGWLIVFTQPSVAGSYCVQFLAQYLANNLYMRTRVDGQWGTWVIIK